MQGNSCCAILGALLAGTSTPRLLAKQGLSFSGARYLVSSSWSSQRTQCKLKFLGVRLLEIGYAYSPRVPLPGWHIDCKELVPLSGATWGIPQIPSDWTWCNSWRFPDVMPSQAGIRNRCIETGSCQGGNSQTNPEYGTFWITAGLAAWKIK